MFLKIMGKNKNKHRKVTLFGRCKLDSIEKIISKALTDTEINCKKSHYLIMKQETIADWKKTLEWSILKEVT